MNKYRSNTIDKTQSSEYSFPYHYLPSVTGFPNFTKIWKFSVSYIAAINLFINWLKKEIKIDKTHLHMDYGCGDGGFIYHIKQINSFRNIRFFGVDNDDNAIRWAKQFLNQKDFICGDVAQLPSSIYDSGSLIEVYEHIPPNECPNFLKHISNSLKKGASLFVTVPSLQKKISKKHYRHFDFNTLRSEFSEYFVIEDIFGFERKNLLTKLIMRIFYCKWWTVETKFTNKILIKTLQAKYSKIDRCGRIGLVLRKK